MSDAKKLPGTIGWIDLTVEDAEGLRAFYEAVLAWRPQAVPMDGYADYAMLPPGPGERGDAPGDRAGDGADAPAAVGGICHRRGPNTGVPAGWIIYFLTRDLAAALAAVEAGGGTVVARMGAQAAFVRDPAGNAFALYQM